ncbi:hypothetical protein ACLOJK_019738 [Asimina triloba]
MFCQFLLLVDIVGRLKTLKPDAIWFGSARSVAASNGDRTAMAALLGSWICFRWDEVLSSCSRSWLVVSHVIHHRCYLDDGDAHLHAAIVTVRGRGWMADRAEVRIGLEDAIWGF